MSIEANDLDAVNYKNGQKNNWRRTMWNVVREWTPNPRDALVLYLPGAANLDRPVAESKGFRAANLIAIERDKKVAQHIRREYKQTVIDEELNIVMPAWSGEHRVSAVIADLVSGFDAKAGEIVCMWLAYKAFCGSTLILNMQRGREQDITSQIARRVFDSPAWIDACGRYDVSPMSRALLTYAFLPVMASHVYRGNRGLERGDHDPMNYSSDYFEAHRSDCWKVRFLPSYVSGRVTMDSIAIKDLGVCSALRTQLDKPPRDDAAIISQAIYSHERVTAQTPEKFQNVRGRWTAQKTVKHMRAMWRTQKRIRAAMAVRTMRLNGQL